MEDEFAASGNEASSPAMVLVQRVTIAYLQRTVTQRAERALSVNEDLVLLHLAAAPRTSADLCRRIGITSASMTHIVAGLVERGLIRRLRDDSDRRRILLYVTKAAVAGPEAAELAQELDCVLGEFPERERRAIVRFMHRVAAAMDED